MRPDGNAQVFLAGNEAISIPFVYQNLSNESESNGETPNKQVVFDYSKEFHSSVLHISFLSRKQVPIAILDLVVHSRNFYIDRVIRLFRCENELVHKIIRYPASSNLPSLTRDGSPLVQNSREKFLKCNNPNVVCSQPSSVSMA